MHRVLVIDDQSSVRAAFRLSLQYLGFSVEEAQNGEEGLQKARATTPDLILCDFDMPVMDGLQTVEQVRKDPVLGRVPLIIISGMVTGADQRRLMNAGANAILQKPFALDDLNSLVRRYLNVDESGKG
jgi:CheY-like chemotaxis protein